MEMLVSVALEQTASHSGHDWEMLASVVQERGACLLWHCQEGKPVSGATGRSYCHRRLEKRVFVALGQTGCCPCYQCPDAHLACHCNLEKLVFVVLGQTACCRCFRHADAHLALVSVALAPLSEILHHPNCLAKQGFVVMGRCRYRRYVFYQYCSLQVCKAMPCPMVVHLVCKALLFHEDQNSLQGWMAG